MEQICLISFTIVVALLLVPRPPTCAASGELKREGSPSRHRPCVELWFDPPSKKGLSEEEVKIKQRQKYWCGVNLGILPGYRRGFIPPFVVRDEVLKVPKYKNDQAAVDRCMSSFLDPLDNHSVDIYDMHPLDRHAAVISAMSRLCPVMLVY